MDKLDMLFNLIETNKKSREDFQNNILERLERLEGDISDLKTEIEDLRELKGKLTGACLTVSTVIGLIPFIFKHLG